MSRFNNLLKNQNGTAAALKHVSNRLTKKKRNVNLNLIL